MEYLRKSIPMGKNVLANDHYVAVSYDCSQIATDGDGVIAAGTVVPSNTAEAVGVLMQDVIPAKNPNGSIIVHGFVNSAKLPVQPSTEAKAALKLVAFVG